MTARLVVLGTALVLLVQSDAFADDAANARSFFKKGIEEYKAKKYGEASISLLKSYELDPKPDTLFALAQAERNDGRCADAIPRYKKLLESTTDMPTAKAIQSNLDLCSETASKPPAVTPADDKPVDAPKPVTITKTVVRTERRADPLTTVLFASGGIALGGSVGLFLASRSSSDDSARAATLDESNRLFDRSKTERVMSFAAGGVGVALIGLGVFRVIRSGKSSSTEVAAAPVRGGATFWVSSRW